MIYLEHLHLSQKFVTLTPKDTGRYDIAGGNTLRKPVDIMQQSRVSIGIHGKLNFIDTITV